MTLASNGLGVKRLKFLADNNINGVILSAFPQLSSDGFCLLRARGQF